MTDIRSKNRSLSNKYTGIPKQFDDLKFTEAIDLLKLVSTENVCKNSNENNDIYLDDVMFVLMQVGDKLETSSRMFKQSTKRLNLDELQVCEPVKDSFFENLNVNNDWTQTLSAAQERRASQAVYESIKIRKFDLDEKTFMSFKSFVFGVASLKEQVNLLIYKTNEFKEDGMLQNLKFYKHCLTQITRLINLVAKTLLDMSQKLVEGKKTGLGKFEKTLCFQSIKKRKGKVFREYENQILQNKQEIVSKLSKVKGLDSDCLWTKKQKITTNANLSTTKNLKNTNLKSNKSYLMSSINRNIPTYFKVDVVNNTKAKFKSITKKQNKLPIVIETTLSGTLEE